LICSPPGPIRTALEELLLESELFEVVARLSSADNLANRCRAICPDVLILDEGLAGADVHRLARTLTLERPLPTLLLVDEEQDLSEADDELLRILRVQHLAKRRLLATEPVGRASARTRLRLLATRSMEPKHTVPRGNLRDVVEELLAEEPLESDGPREPALRWALHPLDLVVLIVDLPHARDLAEVLPSIRASRLPVVMHVEDLGAGILLRRAAAKSGLPVGELHQPTAVRRATGLLFAPAERKLWLDRDVLRLEDGPPDPARLIDSLASAEGTVLPLLASDETPLRDALRRLARARHPAAFLAADGGARTPVPPPETLYPSDLVWLLRHAYPRRV